MNYHFPELRRKTLCSISILAVAVACTPTPTHVVRPLPNFVDVAIEPGDTVIVTTHERKTNEFIVTKVTENALHGAGQPIKLIDIKELKKVSRERPPSPCGGDMALGCSLPLLVLLASKEHAHYKKTFYDACEQHDYCYRHGVRTYGLDRTFCDEEFLNNMQTTCPRSSKSTIGTIFQMMGDSLDSPLTCQRVANDFYLAARDFGENHFKTSGSSYCEYDGPP